ncbi:hypothetical protein NQ317_008299 [Molorchus minor]|uniref:CCHC-type domain-containing protein n=1 Tax=Molorchus minor TaxID=1323400 RepID=A0ABQ9J2I1_9CUCU|nr:hypothetical protein NQ317_008299 [Molorchus minor]
MSLPTTNITNTTTTVVNTTVTTPIVTPGVVTGQPGPSGLQPVGAPTLFVPGAVQRIPTMYSLGMIASTLDNCTGKDIHRYLEKLELRAKLDGWSEDETLNLLKFKCVGAAYDFLKSDSNLDSLNYRELKSKLVRNFAVTKLPGESQYELSKCYQRHDETVTSYCTRLKVLGTKVLEEDLRNSTLDEMPGIRKKGQQLMLNQFKLGLRKDILKEIGVLLLREEDLTLEKAEEIAKFQETTLKMLQGSRHQQVLQVSCYGCGQIGHRKSDCWKNGRGPEQHASRCYSCNQSGHWVKDCPMNRQEERSEHYGRGGYNMNSKQYGTFQKRTEVNGRNANINGNFSQSYDRGNARQNWANQETNRRNQSTGTYNRGNRNENVRENPRGTRTGTPPTGRNGTQREQFPRGHEQNYVGNSRPFNNTGAIPRATRGANEEFNQGGDREGSLNYYPPRIGGLSVNYLQWDRSNDKTEEDYIIEDDQEEYCADKGEVLSQDPTGESGWEQWLNKVGAFYTESEDDADRIHVEAQVHCNADGTEDVLRRDLTRNTSMERDDKKLCLAAKQQGLIGGDPENFNGDRKEELIGQRSLNIEEKVERVLQSLELMQSTLGVIMEEHKVLEKKLEHRENQKRPSVIEENVEESNTVIQLGADILTVEEVKIPPRTEVRCPAKLKKKLTDLTLEEFQEYRKENAIPDTKNVKIIKGDLFTAPDDYRLAQCVSKDFKIEKGIAKELKTKFGGVDQLRNQRKEVGEVAHLGSELTARLKRVYSEVYENTEKAKCSRIAQYNKKTKEKAFAIGDLVYLRDMAAKIGISKKLAKYWKGPYRVIKKIGPVTYKIQKVGTREEQVVHVNRLKPYYGSKYSENEEEQVSDESEEESGKEDEDSEYEGNLPGVIFPQFLDIPITQEDEIPRKEDRKPVPSPREPSTEKEIPIQLRRTMRVRRPPDRLNL